jgi:hypothetical protein
MDRSRGVFAWCLLMAGWLFLPFAASADDTVGVLLPKIGATTSAFKYNRQTGTFDGTLTLTNRLKPKQPLYDQLTLVLVGVNRQGATLANAEGLTSASLPYLKIRLPARTLAPGKSLKKIPLRFDNPSRRALIPRFAVYGLLAPNHAPTAVAGADRTALVGDTIELDGSASNDPDGHRLSYRWSLPRKPIGSLAHPRADTGLKTGFSVDTPGTYTAQLIVSDGIADSAPAQVTVTVSPPANQPNGTNNAVPIANAGANQTATVGQTVTLDGSASSDPDHGPKTLTFTWSQVSGPAAALSDAAAAKPSFTPSASGTYVFSLFVNDGQDSSAPAQVTVTVSSPANQPPAKVSLVGVSSLSGDQITAEWLPATDDQTPQADLVYTLHLADTAGFSPSAATAKFTQTGALSATVDGLTPATRYYAKVVATDEQGQESWSNELGVTTAGVIAQPTSATVKVQDAAQAPQVTADSVTYTAAQAPEVGQYLASAESGGYLRRVTGVEVQGNQVTATTAPASLNEIFDTLELNTSIKLEPLPATAASTNQAITFTRALSRAVQTPRSRTWPETGLTLIDENANPGVSGLSSSAAPGIRYAIAPLAAQSVDVNGGTQTAKGRYLDFSGPAYMDATPAQTSLFQLAANVARPGLAPLQICSITLDSFTHVDASKRAIIAADQGTGRTLQVGTAVITNAEQTATLNVIWNPDARYVHDGGLPYYATFKVVLDQKADGCSSSILNLWAETLTLEVPIYVTMGKLPDKEKKSLTFSGGFTVQNDVTFTVKPEIGVSALIQHAQLQTANLEVDANIEFLQQLVIQANGGAKLDETLDLLLPRRFVKVFAAGGVPVVVSGEFGIKLRVEGQAKGAVHLTEVFRYAFPKARFGLRYANGAWTEIREFVPEYQFTVDGEGNAGADLKLTLVPDLTLHFYDAASGRMLVEPYLYADAGIQGQFKYLGLSLEDLDYWFTKLEAGGGLDLRLYAGLHIFDYNIASYPKNVDVTQTDKFKCLTIIGQSGLGSDCKDNNGIPIAAIPKLTAEADFSQIKPDDSCAIMVKGEYQNIPNPFKTHLGIGPDAYISFENWLDPKVVPLSSGGSLTAGDTTGQYWFHYSKPGDYEIRLPGQNNLGWFIRQVAFKKSDPPSTDPLVVSLTDADGDGMVDQWESRWWVSDPNGDADGDGFTNLREFQMCTVPSTTGLLNDTGIVTCSTSNTNGLACPLADYPGQDGDHGRDLDYPDASDGHAGFSYTKIDGNGNDLPASASQWSCVRDNVTGLMWENKTDDGGLHDWDWHYTWYEPDNSKNGGFVGYPNGGSCVGTSGGCDTHGFVQAVNRAGWCGHRDWRMPTVEELEGLVSFDRINPAIDTAYFPFTASYWYWAASPSAAYIAYARGAAFLDGAWTVHFGVGHSVSHGRNYRVAVRLVRGGQ